MIMEILVAAWLFSLATAKTPKPRKRYVYKGYEKQKSWGSVGDGRRKKLNLLKTWRRK